MYRYFIAIAVFFGLAGTGFPRLSNFAIAMAICAVAVAIAANKPKPKE